MALQSALRTAPLARCGMVSQISTLGTPCGSHELLTVVSSELPRVCILLPRRFCTDATVAILMSFAMLSRSFRSSVPQVPIPRQRHQCQQFPYIITIMNLHDFTNYTYCTLLDRLGCIMLRFPLGLPHNLSLKRSPQEWPGGVGCTNR